MAVGCAAGGREYPVVAAREPAPLPVGIEQAGELGWKVVRTSAKTGEGVEEAFLILARAMASR